MQRLALAIWLTMIPVAAAAQATAATAETSAKTWLHQRDRIEEYLKTAEVVGMEELKVGVTRPRRATLAPGGPVGAIAWKVVPPGRSSGYWESYKSEIASYELDKLLGLDMVPPTVEKRVKGDLGAAVMWCDGVKSFKDMGGVPTPPSRYIGAWVRQLSRAKMFDNLIGNLDPNMGNWLVDPSWNLILIDHTRAFTTDKGLVHKKMDYIDGPLWEKMQALTLESLQSAIGQWVGERELKAMLDRRERMRGDFEKQIRANPDVLIK
jgi:hypothetical protein